MGAEAVRGSFLSLVSSRVDLRDAFGSQDEAQLEEEERVREEKRRREEEERQQAAQRERERREKEELERAMRDEAERLEREKRDRTSARSTSGVRGVRGTRASIRAGVAARGGSRTGAPFLKHQLPSYFFPSTSSERLMLWQARSRRLLLGVIRRHRVDPPRVPRK